MREHLEQCLSNATMKPFPVIRYRRGGNARIETTDVAIVSADLLMM